MGINSAEKEGESLLGSYVIKVAGLSFAALADSPEYIEDQTSVDSLFATFLSEPPMDFRTEEVAHFAAYLATNPVAHLATNGPLKKTAKLGRIAYLRPGIGNIMFSPGWIVLLACYFDVVVLMYTNMTDTARWATEVRRVFEIEGVEIPLSLRSQVEIIAVGSEKSNALSFLQQSDVSLLQLEMLRVSNKFAYKTFNNNFPTWVFAHSQAVPDALLTRHRLGKEGLSVFENIIGIAGAVKGGRLLSSAIASDLVDNARLLAGDQGARAFKILERNQTIKILLELLDIPAEADLELYVQEKIVAAFAGVLNKDRPAGNSRAVFMELSEVADNNGVVKTNDGVVDVDSAGLGQHIRFFEQVDHMQIIEDPELLMVMLRDLFGATV